MYDKQGDGRRAGTLRKQYEGVAEENKTFSAILGAIRTSPDNYAQSIVARLRTDEKYVDIANFIREHPFDGAALPTASTQSASPTAGTADGDVPEAPTEAAPLPTGPADREITPEVLIK